MTSSACSQLCPTLGCLTLRLHHEVHSHPSASLCRDLVSCSFRPWESTKDCDSNAQWANKKTEVPMRVTTNIYNYQTNSKRVCKLSRCRLVHLPAERAPQTLRFLQVLTSPRLAKAYGTCYTTPNTAASYAVQKKSINRITLRRGKKTLLVQRRSQDCADSSKTAQEKKHYVYRGIPLNCMCIDT